VHGAPLFREFWRRAHIIKSVWRVPFDASHPIETARGLDLADASVKASLLQSIHEAASALRRAGFPIRSMGSASSQPAIVRERTRSHGAP